MKKIIAIAAAFFISLTGALAEHTFHIGMYFPVSNMTYEWTDYSDSKDDISTYGCGLNLDYTHVADSGFTFKVGFNYGYAESDDIKDLTNRDDVSGDDFDFAYLGFGGSFIHNKRMTLSLTGDIGFKLQNFTDDNDEISIGFFTFYIGPELSYTYRFNDHVGLFANFGIFFSGGTGWADSDYSLDLDADVDGVTYKPSIGLALTI